MISLSLNTKINQAIVQQAFNRGKQKANNRDRRPFQEWLFSDDEMRLAEVNHKEFASTDSYRFHHALIFMIENMTVLYKITFKFLVMTAKNKFIVRLDKQGIFELSFHTTILHIICVIIIRR